MNDAAVLTVLIVVGVIGLCVLARAATPERRRRREQRRRKRRYLREGLAHLDQPAQGDGWGGGGPTV